MLHVSTLRNEVKKDLSSFLPAKCWPNSNNHNEDNLSDGEVIRKMQFTIKLVALGTCFVTSKVYFLCFQALGTIMPHLMKLGYWSLI
jgi:hypothetical protein